MKEVIKNKWVKALRSGDYKQSQDQLKDSVGFCCLGVLCDLAPRKVGEWEGDGTIFNGNECDLSESVMKWSGVCSADGDLPKKRSGIASLANLNDSGRSFKQIANVIEKHWETL